MNQVRYLYDVTVSVAVDTHIEDFDKLLEMTPYLNIKCDNGSVDDKQIAHVELVDQHGKQIREWIL